MHFNDRECPRKKNTYFLQIKLLHPEYVLHPVYVFLHSQKHTQLCIPRCKMKQDLIHEKVSQKVFIIVNLMRKFAKDNVFHMTQIQFEIIFK